MAQIRIGEAVSLGAVEDFSVSLDDRQTMIQTIGGNVVQDFGVVDSGQVLKCTATFRAADAQIVFNYWKNRTLVDVVDTSKNTWTAQRVKVISWSYVNNFPNVYQLDLEFWGV